jgi:hypothetical protein
MLAWLVDLDERLEACADAPGSRFSLLARRLAARGHRVVMWGSDQVGAPGDERIVGPNQSLRSLVGDPSRGPARRGVLRRDRKSAALFEALAPQADPPDLVVATLPGPHLAAAAARFASEAGVPLAIDVRSPWPEAITWNCPKALRPVASFALRASISAARSALQGASAIVAGSASELDRSIRRAERQPGECDRVFPAAYDDRATHDAGRTEAEGFWNRLAVRADHKFRLTVVGSLGRDSMLEPFLDAARSLEHRHPGAFELVVGGTGAKEHAYRRRGRDCPAVRVVGPVTGAQAAVLLARSTVGLAAYAPGAPHSLPRQAIAHLACSLPVLSTLVATDLETLLARNDCGVTLEAPRVEHVVELLRVWRAQPGRLATLSANARRLYRTQFHAEAVTTAMAEHLEAVALGAVRSTRTRRAA